MITETAVTPFPAMLVFPDVDPPVLVRDEGVVLDRRSMLDGAWTNYMRRVLPPIGNRQTWTKSLPRPGSDRHLRA